MAAAVSVAPDNPPEVVLRDVRNGLVSIEAAREKYGVTIRHDGAALGYSIGEAETAQLRNG